jgi:hypothetical protein
MGIIENFIKEIDLFAISISFRYNKDDEKYSTFFGGIITLLIIVIYITFGLIYFIPFVKKENFTIFYNTINLPYADPVLLDSNNSFLAIGLQCGNQQEKELNKYLDFKALYFKKEVNNYGSITKEKEEIPLINNNYSNLLYINNLNKTIKGRYGDPEFQYIEISLNSKKNLSEYMNEIDKILFKNDCKLEFHYTDYTIDYNQIEEPFKEFKNEIFLQLNPYFCLKMNTFFMKQTLSNDNDLLFQYKDEEINKYLFSRSEQYFLYKGNSNTKEENRPKDYESYAKIYLRADSRRIEIKRKYQSLFEFWADTFSFWDGMVAILSFILNSFYKFYAFYNIGNEIFFSEIKDLKKLNISKRSEELKKIKDIIAKSNKNVNKESQTLSNINLNNINLNIFDKEEKSKEQNEMNYSFMFFEVPMVIRYFSCLKLIRICKCQNLKKKESLFSLQKDIMKEKLDIALYIQNMLYLDNFKNKEDIEAEEDKQHILKYLDNYKITPVHNQIKKGEESNEKYCKNYFWKLDNKNIKNVP